MTPTFLINKKNPALQPFVGNLVVPVDLNSEASIAYELDFTTDRHIVNLRTNERDDTIIHIFSSLKYGDKRAIDFFANAMVENALVDPNFLRFVRQAVSLDRQVYITSPGIYNVPSSSNLLLKAVAARLNVALVAEGMPSTLVYELKKLTAGDPKYSQRTVEERQRKLAGSLIPSQFQDSFVIFVDDIYISGTVANLAKQNLLNGAAAGIFFLLGAHLSAESVARTNGQIEETLNTWHIDGSLESILPILNQPDFEVVQKTLRVVLTPENGHLLNNFLTTVSDRSLLKLYQAAANNDFWHRYDGLYAPSLALLQQVLYEKGWLNDKGHQLLELAKPINKHRKVAVLEIDTRDQIVPQLASLYSRMKYGDPQAVRAIAVLMLNRILSDPQASCWINDLKVVSITSSAYGEVPTAANAIALDVARLLEERGAVVEHLKIERSGDFATTHYGTMSPEERAVRMQSRKIYITSEVKERLKGAKLIVIDDVNVTGSHERTINEVLRDTEAEGYLFCYLIDFTNQMAKNDPQAEEYLNRAYVKTVIDLLPFFNLNQESGLVFQLNARAVKFILTTDSDTESNLSKEEKVNLLIEFLGKLDDQMLQLLYKAASSTDGYSTNPKFKLAFQLVENELLERGLISIRQLNQANNRIVDRNVTLDSTGHFVDMETGEDLDYLIRKYSLAKFGAASEISSFARDLAKTFLAQLDDPRTGLLNLLERIKENCEFIVIFTPGSRNVKSASNIILAKAIEMINVDLTLRGLPTMIFSQLSRLESNTANYATLTAEERESRPDSTKTILPGVEFYANKVHVFFGDDVRITGTTADRIESSTYEHGAMTFHHIYTLLLDPRLAFKMPSLESDLNQYVVSGKLDESIEYILSQPDFEPVQRLVRLILHPDNKEELLQFLIKINNEALSKLYVASLNNDYLNDSRYAPSVQTLKQEMIERKLANSNGSLVF